MSQSGVLIFLFLAFIRVCEQVDLHRIQYLDPKSPECKGLVRLLVEHFYISRMHWHDHTMHRRDVIIREKIAKNINTLTANYGKNPVEVSTWTEEVKKCAKTPSDECFRYMDQDYGSVLSFGFVFYVFGCVLCRCVFCLIGCSCRWMPPFGLCSRQSLDAFYIQGHTRFRMQDGSVLVLCKVDSITHADSAKPPGTVVQSQTESKQKENKQTENKSDSKDKDQKQEQQAQPKTQTQQPASAKPTQSTSSTSTRGGMFGGMRGGFFASPKKTDFSGLKRGFLNEKKETKTESKDKDKQTTQTQTQAQSVPITWLHTDPGRQLLTGSFHPVDDDKVFCSVVVCWCVSVVLTFDLLFIF